MSKAYRLTLIAFSLIILIGVGYFLTGSLNFVLNDFWFTSGLLLLILLSLIDQPHFSKDSNIFINAVTAGVSLLLVKMTDRDFIFWLFFSVTLYLLLCSYVLLWVRQKQLAEESKAVKFFSRFNREIGKPEALFSAFFIWGAYKQFGTGSNEFNALLLYWVIFIVLNIPSLAKTIEDLFVSSKEEGSHTALGQIFGVQSKNTFLVKLFDSSKRIAKASIFDFVEFKYSTDKKVRKGLLLDTYLLNQEQWIKILSNNQIEKIFNNKIVLKNHNLDIVYKLNDIPQNDFLKRFVGIITENSKINNIRFIYNSQIEVSEGQLLEVSVNGKNVLYQIVEGVTKIETLEHKNQTELIIGEAIQLGTWNKTKFQFEQ